LIVEHGKRRYGLIVDDVETIVSADEHDRIRVPSLMLGDIGAGFNMDARADLREAVELRGEAGSANAVSQTVLILPLARTAERVDAVLAA
jgi:purine-binding chemotaxis protein CheW